MAILVAGSTGTIGNQILPQLQSCGTDVRALTRSPNNLQSALAGGIAVPKMENQAK